MMSNLTNVISLYPTAGCIPKPRVSAVPKALAPSALCHPAPYSMMTPELVDNLPRHTFRPVGDGIFVSVGTS